MARLRAKRHRWAGLLLLALFGHTVMIIAFYMVGMAKKSSSSQRPQSLSHPPLSLWARMGLPPVYSRTSWNRRQYARATRQFSLMYHYAYTELPCIIWQTYKSKVLPLGAENCTRSWRRIQPHWEAYVVDDAEVAEYFRVMWPKPIVSFFESLPLPVMKADLWRYAVLATHGGVYADIDTTCVQAIDRWFVNVTVTTRDVLLVGIEDVGANHFVQWRVQQPDAAPHRVPSASRPDAIRFYARAVTRLARGLRGGCNSA